ncbi:hypothetical protein KC947_02390 [Candidatus Saccharibacteria bacterium]|nr:hypothetical protein [Candidatus Saccharibacteria bacterium]
MSIDNQVSSEAVRWVRRPANKKVIIERFADLEEYKSSEHPLIFFTAGSPGAGETEFINGFKDAVEGFLNIKPVIVILMQFGVFCLATQAQTLICFKELFLLPSTTYFVTS